MTQPSSSDAPSPLVKERGPLVRNWRKGSPLIQGLLKRAPLAPGKDGWAGRTGEPAPAWKGQGNGEVGSARPPWLPATGDMAVLPQVEMEEEAPPPVPTDWDALRGKKVVAQSPHRRLKKKARAAQPEQAAEDTGTPAPARKDLTALVRRARKGVGTVLGAVKKGLGPRAAPTRQLDHTTELEAGVAPSSGIRRGGKGSKKGKAGGQRFPKGNQGAGSGALQTLRQQAFQTSRATVVRKSSDQGPPVAQKSKPAPRVVGERAAQGSLQSGEDRGQHGAQSRQPPAAARQQPPIAPKPVAGQERRAADPKSGSRGPAPALETGPVVGGGGGRIGLAGEQRPVSGGGAETKTVSRPAPSTSPQQPPRKAGEQPRPGTDMDGAQEEARSEGSTVVRPGGEGPEKSVPSARKGDLGAEAKAGLENQNLAAVDEGYSQLPDAPRTALYNGRTGSGDRPAGKGLATRFRSSLGARLGLGRVAKALEPVPTPPEPPATGVDPKGAPTSSQSSAQPQAAVGQARSRRGGAGVVSALTRTLAPLKQSVLGRPPSGGRWVSPGEPDPGRGFVLPWTAASEGRVQERHLLTRDAAVLLEVGESSADEGPKLIPPPPTPQRRRAESDGRTAPSKKGAKGKSDTGRKGLRGDKDEEPDEDEDGGAPDPEALADSARRREAYEPIRASTPLFDPKGGPPPKVAPGGTRPRSNAITSKVSRSVGDEAGVAGTSPLGRVGKPLLPGASFVPKVQPEKGAGIRRGDEEAGEGGLLPSTSVLTPKVPGESPPIPVPTADAGKRGTPKQIAGEDEDLSPSTEERSTDEAGGEEGETAAADEWAPIETKTALFTGAAARPAAEENEQPGLIRQGRAAAKGGPLGKIGGWLRAAGERGEQVTRWFAGADQVPTRSPAFRAAALATLGPPPLGAGAGAGVREQSLPNTIVDLPGEEGAEEPGLQIGAPARPESAKKDATQGGGRRGAVAEKQVAGVLPAGTLDVGAGVVDLGLDAGEGEPMQAPAPAAKPRHPGVGDVAPAPGGRPRSGAHTLRLLRGGPLRGHGAEGLVGLSPEGGDDSPLRQVARRIVQQLDGGQRAEPSRPRDAGLGPAAADAILLTDSAVRSAKAVQTPAPPSAPKVPWADKAEIDEVTKLRRRAIEFALREASRTGSDWRPSFIPGDTLKKGPTRTGSGRPATIDPKVAAAIAFAKKQAAEGHGIIPSDAPDLDRLLSVALGEAPAPGRSAPPSERALREAAIQFARHQAALGLGAIPADAPPLAALLGETPTPESIAEALHDVGVEVGEVAESLADSLDPPQLPEIDAPVRGTSPVSAGALRDAFQGMPAQHAEMLSALIGQVADLALDEGRAEGIEDQSAKGKARPAPAAGTASRPGTPTRRFRARGGQVEEVEADGEPLDADDPFERIEAPRSESPRQRAQAEARQRLNQPTVDQLNEEALLSILRTIVDRSAEGRRLLQSIRVELDTFADLDVRRRLG